MNRPVPVYVAALVAVLTAVVSIAVSLWIADYRAAQRPVMWYNEQWFKANGTRPGGIVFNMGNKNYEFGVRADSVVVIRQHDDTRSDAYPVQK